MYQIFMYRDSAGNQPVKEYLKALSKLTDKDSKLNHSKINDYITLLRKHGLTLREPYIKHLSGDIWELRPLRNRILFFGHNGNEFILLHHFIKKTRKTPPSEIKTAETRMNDYKKRSGQK